MFKIKYHYNMYVGNRLPNYQVFLFGIINYFFFFNRLRGSDGYRVYLVGAGQKNIMLLKAPFIHKISKHLLTRKEQRLCIVYKHSYQKNKIPTFTSLRAIIFFVGAKSLQLFFSNENIRLEVVELYTSIKYKDFFIKKCLILSMKILQMYG